VILPVNFAYRDGAVLIRTAPGSKLDAAAVRASVAFEIDGHDDDYHSGWSVLVKGVLEELDGDQERAYDDLPLTPWAQQVERSHWLRIRADSVTGRRL
jgi:nitroimidazol reductase NimA-like FMN-containing flavoprotein (pyridoxamine 5'-phosphate oxidase superfamily)